MEYRKLVIGALLSGGLLLPVSNDGVEASSSDFASSDSATARITLHIPSQAHFLRASDQHSGSQLCLSHIPAENYHLSIRVIGGGAGEGTSVERRVAGRKERFCVPVSTSQRGKMVLIVAE